MSKLDDALKLSHDLTPAERLRLIESLWRSMPADELPEPTEKELAEVYRRARDTGAAAMDTVPWPIVERMIADCVRDSRPKLYSAPRRFDLAMIFVVTSIYAFLFAGMSALRFPPGVSLAIAGFITLVGIGQALLFRGRRPRTASIIVGIVLYVVPMIVVWLVGGSRAYPSPLILFMGVQTLLGGALLGYIAGVIVGGVFLLADVVRGRFHRKSSSNDETAHDDEHRA